MKHYFLDPQPTNKNSFSRGHIESMVIYSLPWKPQCSVIGGVGDGDRFSQNTHLGIRVECMLRLSYFNKNLIVLTDF
jgi:hypothetical protein